jgi:hypothetical protein
VTPTTRLEAFARRAVAMLAVVYVVGLAVVTLHLARYGVFGVGLAEAQYLLAGMWALGPLVVVGFITGVGVALVMHRRASRAAGVPPRASGSFTTNRDMVIGVLGVTLGMLVMALFLLAFVGARTTEDLNGSFSFGQLMLAGLVTLGFLVAFGWGAGTTMYARSSEVGDIPYRALGIMLAVTSLIAYLGYFTDAIYPRIPSAVGGGAPTAVHMVMKGESATGLLGSVMRGLPTDAACRHRLLWVDREEYIIVDPRDSTNGVEIARDLVAAVRTVTGRVEPCAR